MNEPAPREEMEQEKQQEQSAIVIPAELELICRNWPPQIITNYDMWFKAWRAQFSRQDTNSTKVGYNSIGARWAAFANGKDLNPKLMLEWHHYLLGAHNHKGPRLSRGYISRSHTVLRRFLGWMQAFSVISHNPSFALPAVRAEPPKPRLMWNHDEYRKVIEYGSRFPQYSLYVWLIVLGYHTGMSLVDCALLRWDEVVLKDDGLCFIKKMRAKMQSRLGAEATFFVPIVPGSEVWVWFKRLEAARGTNRKRTDGIEYVHQDAPNIYADKHNQHMTRKLNDLFVKALGARVVGSRTFRNLRQSFCSRLVNSGVDAVLAARMTGHKDVSRLLTYLVPHIRTMQDALIKAWRWVEESGESVYDGPPNLCIMPATPTTQHDND